MEAEHTYGAIWKRFRSGASRRPTVCAVVSLFSGLFLTGSAMMLTWSYGILRGWSSSGVRRGRVRDEEIVVAVIFRLEILILLLILFWRPVM